MFSALLPAHFHMLSPFSSKPWVISARNVVVKSRSTSAASAPKTIAIRSALGVDLPFGLIVHHTLPDTFLCRVFFGKCSCLSNIQWHHYFFKSRESFFPV